MDRSLLRFAGHVRVDVLDDAVTVLDEDGLRTLRGAGIVDLARLVDGRRSLDAVLAAAPSELDPHELRAMATTLIEKGIVEPFCASEARDHQGDAFRAALPGTHDVEAGGASIDVVDLGDPAGTRAVVRALQAADHLVGVRGPAVDGDIVAPAGSGDVSVVVTTDHLDPRLAEIGACLAAHARPWLLVRPSGVRQWIGPFFGAAPGGACPVCLATRLWGHRQAEAALRAELGVEGLLSRPMPASPSSLDIAAHGVALEVDCWRRGVERDIAHGVRIQDHRTSTVTFHRLTRRPQCSSCGDPGLVARGAEVPVRLGEDPVHAGRETDLRTGYGHLVSPVTGVVKALRVDPGPVPGTWCVRTGPTPSSLPRPLRAVLAEARLVNGGAGASEAEARTAALGEAVERWSGQFHGDEGRVRGTFAELGDDALDPRDILLVDPRQSADRARWNARHGRFNQIGPAMVDSEVIEWSPLWSLRDGHRALLPSAMLFHGAPGPAWAHGDSNGCAAGPDRDEAIRRGLLELVERDAVALWWYNRTPCPMIDVDDLPAVRAAIACHQEIGRDAWLLDLTSDLGVPVCAAVSGRPRPDGAYDRLVMGFAADQDPVGAVRRALGELAMTSTLVWDGVRRATDPDQVSWFEEVDTDTDPWLRPGTQPPSRWEGTTGPDRRQGPDVFDLVAGLVAHGLEPFVLDQTRPDVGVPVVRTVVPGLRPMWSRFAPGRLFDVPVALGRLAVPTAYDRLNPRPVFL